MTRCAHRVVESWIVCKLSIPTINICARLYTMWTRCINTRGWNGGVMVDAYLSSFEARGFLSSFLFLSTFHASLIPSVQRFSPLAPVIYPWHEINHRYLDYSLAGYFREFPRLRFYRIVSRRAIATTTSATTTTTVRDREDGGSFVCFRFHPHCDPPSFWSRSKVYVLL